MWNRTIRDMIRRGGGTLWPCGCCVFRPFVGYQVSVPDTGGIVALGDEDAFDVAFSACEKWIGSKSKNCDYYIGIWVDDGKVYVEVSEHIGDIDYAIEAGQLRNQKCIWDWENVCTISTEVK